MQDFGAYPDGPLTGFAAGDHSDHRLAIPCDAPAAGGQPCTMSDRDDIRQPLDHLDPKNERDPSVEVEEPHYPDTGAPTGGSGVSPDTAAEPDEPARHGVAKLPPTSR